MTPRRPRVARDPRARRDLDDIAAYFGDTSLDLEIRFVDAAERTFRKLAEFPEIGSPRLAFSHPTLAGVRVWPIEDFRDYLIFYRPAESGVEILRVLHGVRDVAPLLEDDV